MLMLPEIIVIVTAFLVLIADLFLSERGRVGLAPLAAIGLALAVVTQVANIPLNGEMLGGRFVMDPVAWWFKILFAFTGFITVILSMDLLDGNTGVRMRGIGHRGEYYTMLLFTIAGMMYLISSRDLVTLYVSLELATIPLFALAAWRRDDPKAGEAGLKYVIIGALASAMLLYGMSFLYGITGTMNLDEIGRTLAAGVKAGTPPWTSPGVWLAGMLLLAGVGFKLTLVPFHLWAADVYEGSPAPVTAYLSVASKGAGLAFMFQIFFHVFGSCLNHWAPLLAGLAAITMTLGNCVAIVQNNIKRFMAFSAISQAGYFIMGFLGPSDFGVPAMIFYMLVYVVSNMAVFACIIWYSNETGRETIPEYQGLSITNPAIAVAMMIALFSLSGIPPLSGFVGKFFLFSIASRAGFHWLVAVAAINSTISLYYYLRIVRQMYIEPVDPKVKVAEMRPMLAFTTGILTVAVVLFGIIPGFYEVIHSQTISWLAPMVMGN